MWAKPPGNVVTRFYHPFIRPATAPSSSLTSEYVSPGTVNPSRMGGYTEKDSSHLEECLI